MSEKLEACPFCGADAAIEDKMPYANVTLWFAICTQCYVLGRSHTSKAEAIAAWNARTPANGEQMERVAKAMAEAARAGPWERMSEQAPQGWGETACKSYWRKMAALAAATLPTPTQDARERVKVLEEFVAEYVRVWEAGTGTVYLIDRARTALGNQEERL